MTSLEDICPWKSGWMIFLSQDGGVGVAGGVFSRGNGHSKVYTGVATLYPGHHIRLPHTTKELATTQHF